LPDNEATEPMKNEHFFEDVYEVVRMIPPGRVTSYGAIAEYLGLKRGARMVGWAMNSSHGRDIPAHRVVNRDGLLTGKHFFPAPQTMQQLLEKEGITVIKDQIQDFNKVFWSPADHLAL
jgi:methylated-DNA-protein-cysteine methyltransferase related protein